MVSFDVKSLFTNVPVDAALEVILRRLRDDETLAERTKFTPEQVTSLVEICLRTTYFVYQHTYYEQTEGAAMGSPLVANIFMEHMEEEAIKTCPHTLRCWRRYVDDVFAIVEKGATDGMLTHLNSFYPTIQFTVEAEDEGKLPFLDTLVQRKEDGRFEIGVYRKETHTDRYLSFQSHHLLSVKKGVVTCLFRRAEGITTNRDLLESEKSHLQKVLSGNGYPKALVKNSLHRMSTSTVQNPPEEEPLATAVIPYYQGISEAVRRIPKEERSGVIYKLHWRDRKTNGHKDEGTQGCMQICQI